MLVSGVRISNHLHKLSAGSRVVTECSDHAAGHHFDIGFVYTTSRHALVLGFDDNGNAARFQGVINAIGDLCGQFLLNL